jgi:hypothetical protein
MADWKSITVTTVHGITMKYDLVNPSTSSSHPQFNHPNNDPQQTVINMGSYQGGGPVGSVDPNFLCACNRPAAVFVVKKAGPTQGKKFYQCATKKCQYYEWAPAPAPTPNATPMPPAQLNNDPYNMDRNGY